MKRIGITGGIGSGKTFIARILEKSGYPIFYSDVEAKKLLDSDELLQSQIEKNFPTVFSEGKLNRKELASLVFQDEKKLTALNKLVHPRVKVAFDNWCKEQVGELLFKEAAILIESGAFEDLDHIILITAPETIKLNRAMERDKISEAAVRDRMKNQLSDDEKKKYCDFILVNDGHQAILPQIELILEKIQAK